MSPVNDYRTWHSFTLAYKKNNTEFFWEAASHCCLNSAKLQEAALDAAVWDKFCPWICVSLIHTEVSIFWVLKVANEQKSYVSWIELSHKK